jgi:hypothetical protein
MAISNDHLVIIARTPQKSKIIYHSVILSGSANIARRKPGALLRTQFVVSVPSRLHRRGTAYARALSNYPGQNSLDRHRYPGGGEGDSVQKSSVSRSKSDNQAHAFTLER